MNKLKVTLIIFLLLGTIKIKALYIENKPDTVRQIDIKKEQLYINAVDNYIRSLNEKNLEGILELYAENGTVEDPVGSDIVKGKRALRKFYSGAVTLDLLVTRTGPVRIAGNEVAFPFQLRMEVEGTPMITDIIDVFCFDQDGKIVSMRAFWGKINQNKAEE